MSLWGNMLEFFWNSAPSTLSEETTAVITDAVQQAKDEGYELANQLEMMGATETDPFAVFAHRARNAQFRTRIKRGEAN